MNYTIYLFAVSHIELFCYLISTHLSQLQVFYDLYDKDKERYQKELAEYEKSKEKDNEAKLSASLSESQQTSTASQPPQVT